MRYFVVFYQVRICFVGKDKGKFSDFVGNNNISFKNKHYPSEVEITKLLNKRIESEFSKEDEYSDYDLKKFIRVTSCQELNKKDYKSWIS